METLDLLMETLFRGTNRVVGRQMITKDKLTWAVKNFDPYKSAGLDGIILAMLPNLLCSTSDMHVYIFPGSLTLGHISVWMEGKGAFIPKAGKSNRTSPKDFRPISFS